MLIILLQLKTLSQILKLLPKFQVDNRVRITKYKNIFTKGYTANWSRKIFITASVLKTNPWTYKIKYLYREKII